MIGFSTRGPYVGARACAVANVKSPEAARPPQRLFPSPTNTMSDAQFQKAVEVIRTMPKNSPIKVTQTQQLKFYSLFKQANDGDCNTQRPGMLDFAGRAKWYVR